MKKILIISHWFYPRQNPRAFRAFELYRKLKRKYDVDVLIGDYKVKLDSSQSYHNLDKYDKASAYNKNARLSNMKIVQYGLRVVQYFIGERYLLTSGSFISSNINLANYNVVISIALPFYVHWLVARKLRKYKGQIVSIADCGDPFYGTPCNKMARYISNIQKFVFDTFNYIVIPTSVAMDYYKKFTNDSNKIKVIPQGFDFSEVVLSDYVPHDVPHFAYAGIFYMDKRNPEKFLQFLSSLETDFIFTIYTITHGAIYQNILLKYKQVLGEKLIIKDIIPRLECIKQLSQNDFLINMDNISSTQIPSKIIDYTLSKRPILSFDQNNIPAEKFKDFLQGNYERALTIPIGSFDINNVASQFERLFDGGKND